MWILFAFIAGCVFGRLVRAIQDKLEEQTAAFIAPEYKPLPDYLREVFNEAEERYRQDRVNRLGYEAGMTRGRAAEIAKNEIGQHYREMMKELEAK